MESWQRQFIRYLFPYSASRLRIEEAFLVKNPHIPEFLYKYREFSTAHLDALKRDILYMSSPDRFNDPFDTTVYFDPSRFLFEDLPHNEFIEKAKALEEERRSRKPFRPRTIKNPIRQDEYMERMQEALLKSIPEEAQAALVGSLDQYFSRLGEDLRMQMSDHLRNGFSVLSLSADPTSVLMWSHYSDGHQGFCIEYDFGELSPDDLRRRLCFPVLYRAKKTDATRYLMDTGASNFNNLFGQYLCLLKNEQWSYEQEWRIVIPTGPSHANSELVMSKPNAIILGSAAKPENIKEMTEFCSEKGITLKQSIQREVSVGIDIVEH